MAKYIVSGIVISLVLLAEIAIASELNMENAAVFAADKWLALVDAKNYADGWKEASNTLRAGTTMKQWEQILHSDREPEGGIISRKVKSSTYRSTPPDGKQVELWYETSFQNRKHAVERIWARLDKNGEWRVTGYAITAGEPDLWNILMALLLFLIVISAWYMELKPKRDASAQ